MRFLFPADAGGHLGRLSRLRWRRAFAGASGLAGSLEVADPRALPAPGSAEALAACAGRHPDAEVYPLDSGAAGDLGWEAPPVLTLRELEGSGAPAPREERRLGRAPEAFPARYRPPAAAAAAAFLAPGFRVLRVRETFGVREEILRRIPSGARRLLDVGCGGGETAAEARRRNPGLRAEGIDRRRRGGPAEAAFDAFHEGDALAVLAALAARGERYDAIVAADVLEHVADPFGVLERARAVAEPGATLVASVPNAGSEAIVGDLLSGRFDPVGAGPEDAGHLRWFTRRSFREAVEETGWSDFRCEPIPLPRAPGLAAKLSAAGIAVDAGSLAAVGWVATARA